MAFTRPREDFFGVSLLTTLRSGFTSAVSRRAVPAAPRTPAEETRAALLERLYRDHSDRIYGLCLRMSGDSAQATELAQDVFVRAWEQLDRLQPGSDAGAWLWRLATNVVLNAMRSERRRHARVAPVAEPGLLERAELGTPLPVRRLSLDAAMARLPERAREVFVLHDVEGFAHAEVAEMLGVAEGTVRAHLHRARTLMREALR
jgi:RNA polymerase sigma-70 factor, ECF subfamily